MNKEAYWFKHDSNAKDDPKCIILIEELGLEGYGIFWVLVETLRAQPDFKAPLRILPAIARRHNTSTEKVKAVISRYELFEIEDEEFFYSRSLIDRMQPLLDKKREDSINGIKGNLIKYGYATREELNGMSNDEIMRLNDNKSLLSGGESGGDRYKKREEEKRTEQKREYIPTLSEVKDYFKENGYNPEVAEKAFNIYNASLEDHPKRKYWRDSRDNPIKNWKLKMQSVWFKDENKISANPQPQYLTRQL